MPDLPVPRVEVARSPAECSDTHHWYDVVLVRTHYQTAASPDTYPLPGAVEEAECWVEITGWPLVIDGKVVEPK